MSHVLVAAVKNTNTAAADNESPVESESQGKPGFYHRAGCPCGWNTINISPSGTNQKGAALSKGKSGNPGGFVRGKRVGRANQ